MKKKITMVALFLMGLCVQSNAQSVPAQTAAVTQSAEAQNTTKSSPLEREQSAFKAHLVNDEYQVWLDIDFDNNSILVPGQEIFGKLPGYFGARRDTRKWIISEAKVKGNTAKLVIINDYGSEDLTAELKLNKDGSYTLTQLKGSTIKIVVDRKWVKIPTELVFKRR